MRRCGRVQRSLRATPYPLTCLPVGADAYEGSDAVDAGGAIGAGRCGAVVDVLGAVQAAPAVHAHAAVAPLHVAARATILAGVGLQPTLIHVLGAELA